MRIDLTDGQYVFHAMAFLSTEWSSSELLTGEDLRELCEDNVDCLRCIPAAGLLLPPAEADILSWSARGPNRAPEALIIRLTSR